MELDSKFNPKTVSSKTQTDTTQTLQQGKLLDVVDFLRCTVCLDFPLSPIMACDNGHTLCGQCYPKLKDTGCPTCKLPQINKSSILIEKLAKEANVKIACGFSESGCKEELLSTKFEEYEQHLAFCAYRDISCNEVCKGACKGVSVPFCEYRTHLMQSHGRKPRVPLDDGVISCNFSFPKKESKMRRVCPILVDFDNASFLIQANLSAKEKMIYLWIVILGDQEMAERYEATIKVKTGAGEIGDGRKKTISMECAWKIPIISFHDLPPQLLKSYEDVRHLPVAQIPTQAWGIFEGPIDNRPLSMKFHFQKTKSMEKILEDGQTLGNGEQQASRQCFAIKYLRNIRSAEWYLTFKGKLTQIKQNGYSFK